MTRLRLALAQYPIERLRSIEDFEVKLDDILRAAKEEGADLLVLPEYAAMELAAAFTDAGDAVVGAGRDRRSAPIKSWR